eukprot:TRINITY_DN6421_c0_g3_i1.p1 TRINITY_DN6421_c0_g3~~TRINITY_DN6421_c0_g3_i1.p1  ORF type:complete len:879 (+),score=251.29 TRINITY_DN6421_c0_g3_i1:150-2786(+)
MPASSNAPDSQPAASNFFAAPCSEVQEATGDVDAFWVNFVQNSAANDYLNGDHGLQNGSASPASQWPSPRRSPAASSRGGGAEADSAAAATIASTLLSEPTAGRIEERVLSTVHGQLRLLADFVERELHLHGDLLVRDSREGRAFALDRFVTTSDGYQAAGAAAASKVSMPKVPRAVSSESMRQGSERYKAVPAGLPALPRELSSSSAGPRVAKPCSRPSPGETEMDNEGYPSWANDLEAADWQQDGGTEKAAKTLEEPLSEAKENGVENGVDRASKKVVFGMPDDSGSFESFGELRLQEQDGPKREVSDGTASNGLAAKMQRVKHEEQFMRLGGDDEGCLNVQDCLQVMQKHMDAETTAATVEAMIMHLNADLKSSGRYENGTESATSAKEMNLDAFLHLMGEYQPNGLDVSRSVGVLRKAFHQESKAHFAEKTRQEIEEKEEANREPQYKGYMGLALEYLPAVMILVNALIIGISTDNCHDCKVWEHFELYFLLFFSGEFLIKVKIMGWRVIACGKDKWWNYFDLFCIITALMDTGITWYFRILDGTDGVSLNGLMLIKMLRLARLARLVRLLRFKIFNELKMMVQGVVSGVRVLGWAIVLLLFSIFIMGILTRKLVGESQPEFSTLDAAMFSIFRCVTDGCVAYNGTPLQERLRLDFGPVFMIVYILVFLFFTMGIFNLIMAIFIDNVVTAHVQRKQQQLGENAEKMELLLKEIIAKRFDDQRLQVLRDRQSQLDASHNAGGPGGHLLSRLTEDGKREALEHRKSTASAILDSLDHEESVVTKDVFNTWLSDPEMLDLLETIEVEISTKYELFDALDVDSGGELTVEELVQGLMKLRGPISKNDIVATRLKVAYVTELVEDLCRKLGVPLSADGD